MTWQLTSGEGEGEAAGEGETSVAPTWCRQTSGRSSQGLWRQAQRTRCGKASLPQQALRAAASAFTQLPFPSATCSQLSQLTTPYPASALLFVS